MDSDSTFGCVQCGAERGYASNFCDPCEEERDAAIMYEAVRNERNRALIRERYDAWKTEAA